MKRMSTLYVRDEVFEIIQHDSGYYCAINHKYLDSTGHLLKTLNGLQTNASETMQECVDRTQKAVEIDYLMSTGLSFEDAFNMAYTPQSRVRHY